MLESHWNLVFDLHGVLADVSAVNRNYGNYLEKILVPTGMKREKISEIHELAFNNWISEIEFLFDEWESQSANSEIFMQKYHQIDLKWEKFILSYVPLEHQNAIKPLLEASRVEYEALANGLYPILYPEVISVLTELIEIGHLQMHIASSASSRHVRGAVTLHNLMIFFQELIGYDTVKVPKKASSGEYFKRMLDLLKTIPERVIYIGDSFEEAILTTRLGMNFVLVWRKRDSELKKIPQGVKIVYNLSELIPFVKTILK